MIPLFKVCKKIKVAVYYNGQLRQYFMKSTKTIGDLRNFID